MFKVERKKVMTKIYIQPMIEVMEVCSMDSICAASGAGIKSISISNGGVSPSSYDTEGLFK